MKKVNTRGQFLFDVPLAKYTSWRVGGVASILFKPADLLDLQQTLPQIPKEMPIMFLGLGSNLLVRDGGFKGVVILTQGALKHLTIEQPGLASVEVGVSCASMARFCARSSLGKAEFWAGIPGTMGGALRMNAGCFGGETWDLLQSAMVIDREGVVKEKSKESFQVSYRDVSGLTDNEWFVGATFKLPKGDKAYSLDTIKTLLARRAKTQPTGEYNCGSVFRNPKDDHAARLIEHCGLKGKVLGGASVSSKHANFITNNGSAKAEHIEALIEQVAKVVGEKTGVVLHREVHIVGEDTKHGKK